MTFRKHRSNTISTKRRVTRNNDNDRHGFLFVTLLQTMLCTVMIVGAFVLSTFMGMTEIKHAYSELAMNDTEAVAVFSAASRVANSGKIAQLRQVIELILEQVVASDQPSGGMLFYDREALTIPDGVTTTGFVTASQMRMPLEGRITSGFGPRKNPVTGKDDWHTGVDIAAAEGTAIAAAWPGIVSEVGNDNIYGNYIVMDHGGFQTRYCHCSSVAVDKGMRLRQGETAAFCGSTGFSTGPHLHFELIIDGLCADPMTRQIRWNAIEKA